MVGEPPINAAGLSSLQVCACRIAMRNGFHQDVYPAEVLAEFYGWPVRSPLRTPKGEYIPGQHFSLEEIGEHAHRAARVAVSKALGRLVQREILARYPRQKTGFFLSGSEAQGILASALANRPCSWRRNATNGKSAFCGESTADGPFVSRGEGES